MNTNIATLPQNGIQTKPLKVFRAFTPRLRVIPLGGNGEIGKNMTAYEYGDDILIVDCGIMFPRGEMLGVDYIIPNISYLEERKDKIRGIVFTHGHEDHIGATPYIWPKIQSPIYATKLTAGYIEAKMQENELRPNIRVVKAGDKIQLGIFKIEFMPFSHTFLDDVGLIIDTPEGKVIHISDFRLDPNKQESQAVIVRLKELGQQNVKLLLLESTNVEYKTSHISESVVQLNIQPIASPMILFFNKEIYITHILVNDIEENIHMYQLLLMNIDQVDE